MEITEIKSRLSLEMVLNHYNLKPDKNNRLCCPWHNDRTPSLQLYPKTNTWTCFSSKCDAGSGDQIEFIHRMESRKGSGGSKHEALLLATKLSGGTTESLNHIFYGLQQKLQRSKVARTYLSERNLNPTKIEVGYNPYGTAYKQLQNCIVFPLKNKSGEVVSMYGRSISDKKGSKHYYLKNRVGLYPAYPVGRTKILILTEALIDAATLQTHLPHLQANEQAGTSYEVVSLFGTNGWGEEHSEVIKGLKELEEVIFFMDGDEAGEKAIATYAALVRVLNPEVKVSKVQTPEGEDVNSLVQSHEPEVLSHLIESRIFLFSSEKKVTEKKKEEAPLNTDTELDISNPEFIKLRLLPLQFTVLGGVSMYPVDRLKVTLKIERTDIKKALYRLRQNIDLYNDDAIEKLARKVAERMNLGSTQVQESLLELTERLEFYRSDQLEAKQTKPVGKRILTAVQKEKAIRFLKSEDLLKRTNDAIGKSGVVGEVTNRLLMFLVFTSRLRDKPLHIISLGGSGTGKTYLQEKIAALIPESEKLEITAISENALYYFDRKELQHKLVLVEDLDGANDDKVLYAIRELQSKRRISKTIPIKDSKGNLKTITLQVEGPISLAGTTTRERLYEDNANRSLLIYLDGSKAHKAKIMDYQRALSAGKINEQQEDSIREFMKDVQSVLKNIKVVNPYAEYLNLPESVFKPLRTNAHYLHFIETVTFYHQYQRERQQDENGRAYIETTLEDIESANELLKEVLLAKSDELSKASRRFLELLKRHLETEGKGSFYTSELRLKHRITPTTLNRHLGTLRRYGYIKIVSGSRSKGYEYELCEGGEISKLEASLQTAFDEALEQIEKIEKEKRVAHSPSVAH